METLQQAYLALALSLNVTSARLHELYVSMNQSMHFHLDRGINEVKYNIEHDFIRGWDVYKERAFDYVAANYFEVPASVKRTLDTYSNALVPNTSEHRGLLYAPVQNMLDGRLEVVIRAEEYMLKVRDAYRNGVPLIEFYQTIGRRYDLSYISLDIITANIKEEELNYNEIITGTTLFKESVQRFKELGETYIADGSFNETEYKLSRFYFEKAARRINYRFFMYENNVVEKPRAVLDERIDEFQRLSRQTHDAYNTVERKIYNCNVLLDKIMNYSLSDIAHLSRDASDYLINITSLKTPLCYGAARLDDTVRSLIVQFDEFRSTMRSLEESLYELEEASVKVWVNMLQETSTNTFYQHIYNDSMTFLNNDTEYETFIRIFTSMLRWPSADRHILRAMTKQEVVQMINGDFYATDIHQKIGDLKRVFAEISMATDATNQIGDKDENLLSSFENFRKMMMEFLDGNEINTNFYR